MLKKLGMGSRGKWGKSTKNNVGELKLGDVKREEVKSSLEWVGKNLITQRSSSKQASAVWRKCREFMYVESSLRKKTFYWFSAQWFSRAFFSSHLQRRRQRREAKFSLVLQRRDGEEGCCVSQKRKISAVVCCKNRAAHTHFHVIM